MSAVTGISGIQLSAASAAYAPTNSADVSAIASAYQVVSATATQLNAGTAYVTSINETPISAARAGNAANASLANSAWYDGTGRLISSLPDEATVSSIASAYAESAASSKLDESATADFYSTSNPSGFITGVDLSDYATTAYVDSSVSSFVDSAYVDSQVSGKEDKLTFGYDDDKISAINGSALAGGGAQVVTAVGTETAYTPDGVSDVVTSINGNYISALSADSAFQASYDDFGRALSGLPDKYDVSAIASSYAASSQVVTSLQYATSESATVASTVTADTAVGYGARDISAQYYDYGYGSWIEYDSSKPLVQVRMTAVGNMTNYSSNPYYLYVVPYGATNDGNVSNTGNLTGALAYGEFSGGMNDFIIAEGTGSSIDPYTVGVTFNVTSVPFWGSEPAWWGTIEEHYAVVDNNENTRPVFCVAGGYDGSQLFELRSNVTAEMDFGSIVTVSAVSGINELEIAGAGGGIDSATVSAIASSYAVDVSAAASGAVSAVSSNSASWMKQSSFSGFDGIVTAVGSSYGFDVSASAFMGIDSALKGTTGTVSGSEPYIYYFAQLPDGVSNAVILSAVDVTDDTVDVYYTNTSGLTLSVSLNSTIRQKAIITNASGILTAMSRNRAFQIGFTAKQPEALAFQSDLTGAGVDSATVSAIASAYAESAVSSKLDESATADFYSTSNPSGFIDSAYVDSAVSGKADSSALSSYVPYSSLGYNTASAISGINGSALAAGSTYSAGEGIDITDDVISVETPVDIVAGPGIVIDNPDGNTLRVSTEADAETVLYTSTSNVSTCSLSESVFNFDAIRLYTLNAVNINTSEFVCKGSGFVDIVLAAGNNQPVIRMIQLTIDSAGTTLTASRSVGIFFSNYSGTPTYRFSNQADLECIYKVVGIHRINGGN